ncbi:hypothetical protein H9636_10895 [Ureibacillus sp. Re31]|uniref:Uncharacterized protein n=1 Tax=Ureibacillus galli TaxID=2762222 RepID=A0ABR8XD37_9BACL|nr:hypothetical protein [Ureibacillus galli]MBD8027161.1 hypothetical protein [Ureibacillus galli]
MVMRILLGIVAGGLLGFISSSIIGSALNMPDSTIINGIYFGVISGLLVCLILEINKLYVKIDK